MLICRGTLDEYFHRTGEISVRHPLQDFLHQNQVLVQCETEEGGLLPVELVLHPRDDDHHHGLCQADNQQPALRGGTFHDHPNQFKSCTIIQTNSTKVGGAMGLWLGLGVVQAFQLLTSYLLPLLSLRHKHEQSIKVAS